MVGGGVVRNVGSAIHQSAIFSTSTERHKKAMTPRMLNTQEKKNDFNSKVLNLYISLTSNRNCFETFEKVLIQHADSAIHRSYNQRQIVSINFQVTVDFPAL